MLRQTISLPTFSSLKRIEKLRNFKKLDFLTSDIDRKKITMELGLTKRKELHYFCK